MFILIGTNDIGYNHTAQQVTAPVKSFIASVKQESPQTKIYIQSIFPREEGALPLVNKYNEALETVAIETGVMYLDLTSNFRAENGTLRSDLTTDGLHLNERGYRIWADILNPIINSLQKPDWQIQKYTVYEGVWKGGFMIEVLKNILLAIIVALMAILLGL